MNRIQVLYFAYCELYNSAHNYHSIACYYGLCLVMDNDVDIAWPRELTAEVIILNIIIHIPNFTCEASPIEVSGAQRCTQLIKHVSNDFPEWDLNLHAAKVNYNMP